MASLNQMLGEDEGCSREWMIRILRSKTVPSGSHFDVLCAPVDASFDGFEFPAMFAGDLVISLARIGELHSWHGEEACLIFVAAELAQVFRNHAKQ